jgi:hypothetical protein
MSVEERNERDKAIAQLAAMEETMQKNETSLKIKLAEWYRKKDERERWDRFIEQAPDRRATQSAITQGYNARAIESNEMFWRNAIKNATPTGEIFVPPTPLTTKIYAPHAP